MDSQGDNSLPEIIYSKIRKSEFQAIYDEEILENIINHLNQIGYINFNYLAEGAFGIVLSAKSLNLMRKVAVKLVRITPQLQSSIQNFDDEINILKMNIFIMKDIKQERKLCDNSLEDELELLRKNDRSLSDKILDAINFIHSKNVVHRDLKASNIFMKDGMIKLGDFGISTFEDKTLTSIKGTPIFMAPEIFQQNYKSPVDIYSLGLIFLMIENPKFNYESRNSRLPILCLQFQEGIIPSELNFDVNSVLYKCAAQMIKTNPQERKNSQYYIEQIIQHCSQNNIELCKVISLQTSTQQQNQQRENVQINNQYFNNLIQNISIPRSLKRVKKELLDLENDPIENATVYEVSENSLYYWKVLLKGPKNSFYEDLDYELIVIFPENYPFNLPKISFISPIWHPCIQNIMFGCGHDKFNKEWSPQKTIKNAIQYVNEILQSPLIGCVCNNVAQQQLLNDPQLFQEAVLENSTFKTFEEYKQKNEEGKVKYFY